MVPTLRSPEIAPLHWSAMDSPPLGGRRGEMESSRAVAALALLFPRGYNATLAVHSIAPPKPSDLSNFIWAVRSGHWGISAPSQHIFPEAPLGFEIQFLFCHFHKPSQPDPAHLTQHTRKGFEMENGDETFASPTAAAAELDFDFGQALTNGSGYAASTKAAAASYDVGKMDTFREAKRDLEEKLAAARHENGFLSAEAARLEMQVAKAREDIAAAERAAADAEGQAAGLRADVNRLQELLVRKEEGDERQRQELEAEVGTVRQAKLKLEEEIDALKASAAAVATATIKDREAAPDAAGAPKEDGLASWQGMAAGAAAGAAVTAAVLLIYLRLKR